MLLIFLLTICVYLWLIYRFDYFNSIKIHVV